MGAELRAVGAILRRDFRLLCRHPLNFVNLILLPLYQFLIPSLLLGAAFLVNGRSVGLARTAGTDDIAGFLFVGAAASSLGFGIFWGVTWAIKREVDTGTLEQAWLTPTSRETLVLGSALTSLAVSSVAGPVPNRRPPRILEIRRLCPPHDLRPRPASGGSPRDVTPPTRGVGVCGVGCHRGRPGGNRPLDVSENGATAARAGLARLVLIP